VKEKLFLPDVLPHSHGCNNLLYSFFPLLFLFIIKFSLQFKNLSWQKTKQIELLGRGKGSGFGDSCEVTFLLSQTIVPIKLAQQHVEAARCYRERGSPRGKAVTLRE